MALGLPLPQRSIFFATTSIKVSRPDNLPQPRFAQTTTCLRRYSRFLHFDSGAGTATADHPDAEIICPTVSIHKTANPPRKPSQFVWSIFLCADPSSHKCLEPPTSRCPTPDVRTLPPPNWSSLLQSRPVTKTAPGASGGNLAASRPTILASIYRRPPPNIAIEHKRQLPPISTHTNCSRQKCHSSPNGPCFPSNFTTR
jgi:hypothetical protein